MKKRKGKNKKSNFKIKIILIILSIIIVSIVFRNNISNFIGSILYGYDMNTIEVFREENLYNKIKDNKYSQTLEVAINSNEFNENYLLDYLEINYVDKKDFITNINSLLNNGYKSIEINKIYNKLSNDNIKIVINNDYDKYLSSYLDLKYFKENQIERYLTYQKNNNLNNYKDVITYVNIGLDQNYFENVIKVDKYNDDILVNKYHQLDEKYEPTLVILDSKYSVSTKEQKLTKSAAIAFSKLCEAAALEGLTIKSGSAYRSYSYQLNLYNRYVNQDGQKKADTYAARAGYSEHQTGLATDIMDDNYNYLAEDSNEYKWLIKNSYKYGFILRFPKDKENITGYIFEPWHFRYLGEKLATDVYKSKLTYDEYVARK